MKRRKISAWILGLFLLGSCVEGAYQPAFIISDSSEEESVQTHSEEDHR